MKLPSDYDTWRLQGPPEFEEEYNEEAEWYAVEKAEYLADLAYERMVDKRQEELT